MNEENTRKLFSAFPRLYRACTDPSREMSRGFRCGDGWFDLIYRLSAQIAEYASKTAQDPKVVLVQGRWCKLKLHVLGADAAIFEMIEKAEQNSLTICGECGKDFVREKGNFPWIETLCPPCNTKRDWREAILKELPAHKPDFYSRA